MTDKPDFATLRANRNLEVEAIIEAFAKDRGIDPAEVMTSFDPNACYCACPDGPCEHDWQEWRDFDDGTGGERVCARCGMGAMSHDLRVAP